MKFKVGDKVLVTGWHGEATIKKIGPLRTIVEFSSGFTVDVLPSQLKPAVASNWAAAAPKSLLAVGTRVWVSPAGYEGTVEANRNGYTVRCKCHGRLCYPSAADVAVFDKHWNEKRAFKQGKQIQFKSSQGDWIDLWSDPLWSDDDTYRVKPEPTFTDQVFGSGTAKTAMYEDGPTPIERKVAELAAMKADRDGLLKQRNDLEKQLHQADQVNLRAQAEIAKVSQERYEEGYASGCDSQSEETKYAYRRMDEARKQHQAETESLRNMNDVMFKQLVNISIVKQQPTLLVRDVPLDISTVETGAIAAELVKRFPPVPAALNKAIGNPLRTDFSGC